MHSVSNSLRLDRHIRDGLHVVIDRECHRYQSIESRLRAVGVFGGNILLRQPLLIDILRRLTEKGSTIYLPTKQLELDDEAKDVITSVVDSVFISTDGVGKSQDAIRGLHRLAKLVESAT